MLQVTQRPVDTRLHWSDNALAARLELRLLNLSPTPAVRYSRRFTSAGAELMLSVQGRARRLCDGVLRRAVLQAAGARIRGGITYGNSDKDAAYPADHPVSPEILAATVFHALGIAPEDRIHDAFGRPVPVMGGGQPVTELFG